MCNCEEEGSRQFDIEKREDAVECHVQEALAASCQSDVRAGLGKLLQLPSPAVSSSSSGGGTSLPESVLMSQ